MWICRCFQVFFCAFNNNDVSGFCSPPPSVLELYKRDDLSKPFEKRSLCMKAVRTYFAEETGGVDWVSVVSCNCGFLQGIVLCNCFVSPDCELTGIWFRLMSPGSGFNEIRFIHLPMTVRMNVRYDEWLPTSLQRMSRRGGCICLLFFWQDGITTKRPR